MNYSTSHEENDSENSWRWHHEAALIIGTLLCTPAVVQLANHNEQQAVPQLLVVGGLLVHAYRGSRFADWGNEE